MVDTLPKRSERPPKGHRLRGIVILLVFISLLVGLLVAGGAYYNWATSASGPQTKVTLEIPRGASGSQVAQLLKAKDVIRSTFVFKLMARFRGFRAGFEAGRYTNLTTNMTVQEALDALKKGPAVETLPSVTFPEGLTVAQMAERVFQKLRIPRKAFLKAARSGTYSIPPYLPAGTKTVEGFLFPNTYDFLKDVDADGVIKRLLAEFDRQAGTLPWAQAKTLGVTPYEVVIVASLIEKEARFGPDRAKIARVIYNRLKKGILLQIDATINYALGRSGPILLTDRQVQSPYNTYLHPGLTPTPIASPGRASLLAALTPASGDWLYYILVDCKTGRHGFATTLSEFNRLQASAPHC
jgi:peptidoglycan lytic transglycosylase G